jgi:hypothetical protein
LSNLQKHSIQRLILEAEINAEQTDLQTAAWQNEVENWVRQKFLPSLEVALDEVFVFSNETLRIDKLELDLGVFDPNLLKEKLGNKLRQFKSEIAFSNEAKRSEDKVEIRHLTHAQKTIEAFLFFLETGRLPWWETPVPIQEWETKILEAFSEVTNVNFQFPDAVAVRKRLVGHFSEQFFNELTRKLFAHFYKQSLDFQVDFKKLLKTLKFSAAKQKEVMETVRESMLHFFGQGLSPEHLPLFVISHLPKKEFLMLKRAVTSLPSMANQSEGEKQLIQLFKDVKEKKANIQVVENQVKLSDNSVPEEKEIKDEIYIANAGLVLLNPFIELFFEELKIVKNGQLKKSQRGVFLLQWLVAGQLNASEYELPLNKLLCGIPLDEPVTGTFKLTKREKNEAQNLLEAVVRHWDVLKNTSPAGLQENFLCREGKLTQKSDGDWLLQVDRKSIDILLDHLPWSISMIKLPWMSQMLWVEWQ